MKYFELGFLLGALFIFLVFWLFGVFSTKTSNTPFDYNQSMPSPIQIQEWINYKNPTANLKLDGVVGKETMKYWNEIICNQYVEQYMNRKK